MKIVVVDDEPSLTRMLAHVAERALPDADVRTAASGEEALALLSADGTDEGVLVILSDFNMGPEHMTGLAFLAEVRARHPRSRRVLITGYSRGDLIADGIAEAPLDAFLTKPVNVRDVMDLLRTLAGRAAPA